MYYCNSKDVSRKTGTKHRDVTKIIETIKSSIETISEDDPFYFLVSDYVFEMSEKVYRGQHYTVFNMNRAAYMLLCGRMRSINSLKLAMANISAIEILENRECVATETERELDFYRSIYLTSLMINSNERKSSELKMHHDIVKRFNNIFPEYKYVESEYRMDDNDRLDILAKDKETGRPVLIELKANNKSAHKQLRSYAFNFDNPILVNVSTGCPKKQADGIRYVNYLNYINT